MVNLGNEPDLGRGHWVVLGQEQLELEHASLKRRSFGACVVRQNALITPLSTNDFKIDNDLRRRRENIWRWSRRGRRRCRARAPASGAGSPKNENHVIELFISDNYGL